jgi:hypothetical protein
MLHEGIGNGSSRAGGCSQKVLIVEVSRDFRHVAVSIHIAVGEIANRSHLAKRRSAHYEHPLVEPQLGHLWQAPLRTIKVPHS